MQTRWLNILLTIELGVVTVTGCGFPDVFLKQRWLLHRCIFFAEHTDMEMLRHAANCKRDDTESETRYAIRFHQSSLMVRFPCVSSADTSNNKVT